MEKRWVIKKQGDPETVKRLAAELNIPQSLANLLVQRNVNTFEDARAFFRPSLTKLHDPFLMKDMDAAVKRIEEAVGNKEKILVYGDYDVDGTTAVALVYTFLKSFYGQVDYYVPDRYTEGYGISYKGIEYAADNNYSLIIALDCGIKAVEKVEYAASKNIDFIICDHHRPSAKLPPAVAVLDPKREDCSYPYDELSGCGVGFKLIQAFSKSNGMPFDNLIRYLDLVVVSIASDIVKITGENRILAYYGLKLINTNPRPGIEAILRYNGIKKQKTDSKQCNFTKELSISDLVFMVGPRINAAGRIESARNSVELLVAGNLDKAKELAVQINAYNNQRRNLDMQTTEEALQMIRNTLNYESLKSTIVYNPHWHQGVIGIVASRLIEHFYRPTIVFTESNGLITGSARSIKDFDIYDAIDACGDLLEHFGGHKYAAGLSLKFENLGKFKERFERIVAEQVTERMMTPEVEVDSVLKLRDINSKFWRILKQFAPFGPGNMAPIFQTVRVIDTGYGRIVGEKHIKLTVVHPDISGYPIGAIAFQQKDQFVHIEKSREVNICYHVEENRWNGSVNLQLNIKDIKPFQLDSVLSESE